MSIRNLDALFAPNTVAVFGASERPGSVGATIWRNLRAEFSGQLLGVNPKRREIDGVPVYPSAAALPAVPPSGRDGVRVLSAWLYGWKSVAYLLPGAVLCNQHFALFDMGSGAAA